MSYMKRARELVLAGYSEADAYRIVAQERRRDAERFAEERSDDAHSPQLSYAPEVCDDSEEKVA